MDEIILTISQAYQVMPCDVLSKNRTMPLPQIRHRCFSMLYRQGYKQIHLAEVFGVSQSAISRGITTFSQSNLNQ